MVIGESVPWREVYLNDEHVVALWSDSVFHAIASRALAEAEENKVIEWDKTCKLFKLEYKRPRGTAFFADKDMSGYRYGGANDKTQEIVHGSAMEDLLTHANLYAGTNKFHGVLLNYYRGGNDCVSLHSDKDVCEEEFLGVLSISLGSNRVIRFRNGASKYFPITKENGMVMGMCGKRFQTQIKHEIKRSASQVGWSASFTFRRHNARKRKRN